MVGSVKTTENKTLSAAMGEEPKRGGDEPNGRGNNPVNGSILTPEKLAKPERMRFDRDSLPYLAEHYTRRVAIHYYGIRTWLRARWWGVELGRHCRFVGHPRFRRYPKSRITIGESCVFNSSALSGSIGIYGPCILATLKEEAAVDIGDGCGFSGTFIACAQRIVLGKNVRCGVNTIIWDTNWHPEDPRVGSDAPVTIGDNVWLGANCIVLRGVTIGENTIVGVGSLVARSLPSGVIAMGVPARVIGKA